MGRGGLQNDRTKSKEDNEGSLGPLVETKFLVKLPGASKKAVLSGGLPIPSSAPGRPTAFSKQLRAAVLCLVCGAWQIKTAGRRVYILPWQ